MFWDSPPLLCYQQFILFQTAEYYSIVWIYSSLFIHYPVGEHLGGFQFWDIMNKAAMNIFVQMFLMGILNSVIFTYNANIQKLTNTFLFFLSSNIFLIVKYIIISFTNNQEEAFSPSSWYKKRRNLLMVIRQLTELLTVRLSGSEAT